MGLLSQDSWQLLDEIEAAIAEGDFERVRRASHRLKGSVSHFAAARSVSLARELEGSGEQDRAQASRTLAALRTELGNLEGALHRFLDAEHAHDNRETGK